jgi:hypothetical protein
MLAPKIGFFATKKQEPSVTFFDEMSCSASTIV